MSAGNAERLRRLVEASALELQGWPEERWRQPVNEHKPDGWSALQLLGHLVDSASNNHQRFVRAGFADHLRFPGYDQDAWVAAQGYAGASAKDLLDLFRSFNLHIARVMELTPEPVLQAERSDHNLHKIGWGPFEVGVPVTLEAFMADYVGHLAHHLGQLGVSS